MDLTFESIHDVIHPTAAFFQGPPHDPLPARREGGDGSGGGGGRGGDGDSGDSWLESQLNPKNRIDSLEIPANSLWRIEGCTGLGTQYYATPLFLDDVPPLRIDVFVPEEVAESPLLRELLDLSAAFHTRDTASVQRLGITKHILRVLDIWAKSRPEDGPGSVASLYSNLPFGSRIVFENLDVDIRKIKVTIAHMHELERSLVKHSDLAVALGTEPSNLPEAIDIFQLSLVKQLHDSVCLVRIKSDSSGDVGGDGGNGGDGRQGSQRLWIFKALTSNTKYIYHELKNLLSMEPHPHVMARPKYLVTKSRWFAAGKAVVGFILEYHTGGGLRDKLPLMRIQGKLGIDCKARWAVQLASAMLHVRERCQVYYPDLRLDNTVLSETGAVVMIDFEQRGVWCEFAAPEVNALEYIRILASDGFDETILEPTIPQDVHQRYVAMLDRLLPGWAELQKDDPYTTQPPCGYTSYNVPWLCLSPVEQEAAEVYMLGRVLWCIFEGQSAPQHAAVWQSYRREPDLEFPEFRLTPPALRPLIDKCTRGRRDVLMSNLIVRQGSKLVLRRDNNAPHDNHVCTGQDTDNFAAAEVLRAAREWWKKEVQAAEDFLHMRDEMKARGEWTGNYYERPTLREVLATLQEFQAQINSA